MVKVEKNGREIEMDVCDKINSYLKSRRGLKYPFSGLRLLSTTLFFLKTTLLGEVISLLYGVS
jgi:hypothetical protein